MIDDNPNNVEYYCETIHGHTIGKLILGTDGKTRVACIECLTDSIVEML